MKKTFCNVEALKNIFLEDKISLKYIGYFQNMVSLMNKKENFVNFQGYLSVKAMAESLNIHVDTVRRFFEYCEDTEIIIERNKNKYLDDLYKITINKKYLECFLLM